VSPQKPPLMRVALLNLRYSPNLGDVLICECLEYGVRQAVPGLDVLQLDITGRRDFAVGSARRLAALAVLQRLPQVLRQRIARAVLGRSLRRTLPYWNEALATVDGAVLGGGHLLADADLNFPLKVAAIFGAVANAGLPAAVYAVGVSDNWSRAGQALFRGALTGVDLRHAAVRDEYSRAVWQKRLCPAGIRPAGLARDPGLLAAACYGAPPRAPAATQRLGLCLSHPVALRYHADGPMPAPAAMTAWFVALAHGFAARGFAIEVFATGSPEDEAYLDEAMPQLLAGAPAGAAITRVPRFAGAAAMAGRIATFDLVVAHRLHACVAAYAYGVPHIGFTWDIKMRSFFDSVDRGHFLCEAVTMPVDAVLQRADEAMRTGIDAPARDAVVAAAKADIAALLRNLLPAPAPPT
jgi:polysaccharide pyruvyl transferase WcaK-like protein